MAMSKPVILTGLRASNDLHIGNYFGAVLPLIDMARKRADEHQVNLFVADLHTLTTPTDFQTLHRQIIDNLLSYVAAGLPINHENVYLYRQSFVPAHSELLWILDCFTGSGEMSRMTQFKDKSAKLNDDRISVGLFNYPVLMAADMLLYGANYVPVGEDQSQHLEYTRDIAERMNMRFGELLTPPHPVAKQHEFFGKDQGLRIRDLQEPTKKMSKSDESGRGVIFLSDDPESAAKKIMSAETDSLGEIKFDFTKQPGISNLMQIFGLLQGRALENIRREWEGKSSYGELKLSVAEAVKKLLIDFQDKLIAVDEHLLMTKLVKDEADMNEIASKTLLRVQQAVGLRPKT